MKKILLISLFLYTALNSFSENGNLIGTWYLNNRLVVDYNQSTNYELYSSFILLKGDLFKNNFTPKIDSYNETTKIIFNNDKTGSFIVDVFINEKKANIKLDDKNWKKSDVPQLKEDFSWSIKNNNLLLQYKGSVSQYRFSLRELSNDLIELELIPENQNFREAGVYIRKFIKKDVLIDE